MIATHETETLHLDVVDRRQIPACRGQHRTDVEAMVILGQ